MATGTLGLDSSLREYLLRVSVDETEAQRQLRAETASLPNAVMQISPEQGQFMRLLVELTGASRAIEVGTFTGYSALSVALALPADGRLVACDISEEYTRIGQKYWQQAGVSERIDLRIGPAIESLDQLLDDGEAANFDFAFIDADKPNYRAYYERCLELLRPGGLLAVDNVLWGGSVANPDDERPETAAIRALNDHIRQDERVSQSLVPIGDGVMLARKH